MSQGKREGEGGGYITDLQLEEGVFPGNVSEPLIGGLGGGIELGKLKGVRDVRSTDLDKGESEGLSESED